MYGKPSQLDYYYSSISLFPIAFGFCLERGDGGKGKYREKQRRQGIEGPRNELPSALRMSAPRRADCDK